MNILRRSFLRNQQPGGLVGLEYLEEESDLVYVQKDLSIYNQTRCYVLDFEETMKVLGSIEWRAFSSGCREVVRLRVHRGWRMERFDKHQDINGETSA